MKKCILIIMAFAIAISAQAQVASGKDKTKHPKLPALERLYYPSEKETKIKQAAIKVANEMAPHLKTGNLIPVIFNDPLSGKYGPTINQKTIRVLFMKDENDYFKFTVVDIDPATKRPNGKSSTIRMRPNSKLTVVLFEDSLEPFAIKDENNNGLCFLPDYKTFRKNNPGRRLEPLKVQPGENIVY